MKTKTRNIIIALIAVIAGVGIIVGYSQTDLFKGFIYKTPKIQVQKTVQKEITTLPDIKVPVVPELVDCEELEENYDATFLELFDLYPQIETKFTLIDIYKSMKNNNCTNIPLFSCEGSIYTTLGGIQEPVLFLYYYEIGELLECDLSPYSLQYQKAVNSICEDQIYASLNFLNQMIDTLTPESLELYIKFYELGENTGCLMAPYTENYQQISA